MKKISKALRVLLLGIQRFLGNCYGLNKAIDTKKGFLFLLRSHLKAQLANKGLNLFKLISIQSLSDVLSCVMSVRRTCKVTPRRTLF